MFRQERRVYCDASIQHSLGVGAFALYVSDIDRVFVEMLEMSDEMTPTEAEEFAIRTAVQRFADPGQHLVVLSDCRSAVENVASSLTCSDVEVVWVRGHSGDRGQAIVDAYSYVFALGVAGYDVSYDSLSRVRRRQADLYMGRGNATSHEVELEALKEASSALCALVGASNH